MKSIKITCFKDFLSEPIFYNCHIKIDNKTFIKKKCLEKGISQISDLVYEFNHIYELNVYL